MVVAQAPPTRKVAKGSLEKCDAEIRLVSQSGQLFLSVVTDQEPQFGFALEIPSGDFEAYIFDCDGTLADTMPAHYQSWQTVLGAQAFFLPEAMFYDLGGAPTAQIVKILNERHQLNIPVEETVALKQEIFLKLSSSIAAIEPVVAFAKSLHGLKPLAVASGGHRRIVMNTLRAIGIEDLFDAVITAEDYKQGKPAPDPFLEAARQLKVAPGRCLVFEDTAMGIAAAVAAGMQAVLVPSPARHGSFK
jgi:HAD superfamily hydrolase (TIGR01509 family)